MKIKKEYIILGIVILGLCLYLFQRQTDRTLYQLPQVAELPRSAITKIEFSRNGNPIVLNKKDDQWSIAPQGYLAETDKVNQMLDVIANLTLTALVSESKSYNRYELDDKNKIHVKAWQGQTLQRDFDVGKTAPSFRHTFVRLAGDDRVYHARENFRNRFEVSAENLRDKTVLSFKPADIREIQITRDQQALSLARAQPPVAINPDDETKTEEATAEPAKTIWQSSEGRPGDEAKINRLLTTLSNLRCQQYVADRKKEDFDKPLFVLQLQGGQEYKLSIFAKGNDDDKQYPAVSSANDYPFLLSEGQVEEIMKDPAELLAKADATPAAKADAKQGAKPRETSDSKNDMKPGTDSE
ncbi:MAG: DUF4340 domain-containing protein [Desulfobacterales bacterium]|nr:MAG: DUF4340 domain-containing protein [Desulfobacterales bacterium]